MMKSYNFLIVGDVMIDEYIIGDHYRNSPEANCAILNYTSKELRLGGAANVAFNLKSLNQNCHLIGLIGNDDKATELEKMCDEACIITQLIKDQNRPTTLKTRYVSGDYKQYLRVDKESNDYAVNEIESQIIQAIESISFESYDVIILQDYNKGVLTEKIIHLLLQKAKQYGIKICADPKVNNFHLLSKCDLFKPNIKELSHYAKTTVTPTLEEITSAIKSVNLSDSNRIIITLGEKGIYYQTKDKTGLIDGIKVEDADVSGAGDTVISVLSLMLAEGYDMENMALIANKCGANVCLKQGVSKIEHIDYQSLISDLNIR